LVTMGAAGLVGLPLLIVLMALLPFLFGGQSKLLGGVFLLLIVLSFLAFRVQARRADGRPAMAPAAVRAMPTVPRAR